MKDKKPSSLLAMCFVAIIVLSVWLETSSLPDYASYESIYYSALPGGDWEIFFVFVNYIFREHGFSYDEFRTFIFLVSSVALWIVLHRFWSERPVHYIPDRVANYLLIAFLLAVFIFEFFVVRIRAGFAIGLFCYGIYFISVSRVLWSRLIALMFFVLASFTHLFTAAALSAVLGIPYFFARARGLGRFREISFDLVALTSAAVMLIMLLILHEGRGENLYSALHPVRFVMLALLPILFFFALKSKTIGIESVRHDIEAFPYYFVRYYMYMAAGLIVFYVAGLTSQSGEAIVRLYTLSSLGALLSISMAGSVFRVPISSYLVTINALFFIVTVLFEH